MTEFVKKLANIIVNNPTFLMSEDVNREIRSVINYSHWSSDTIMWIEYFLIPMLVDLRQYVSL